MATFNGILSVLVPGLICYYLFSLFSYQRRMRGAKPPPGPKGLPIIGNVFALAKNPYLVQTFNQWSNEFGDVVQFKAFGQNQILISSEKVVMDLFSKRGEIYSDRGVPPAAAIYMGDIVTMGLDKNDLWRRQRKMLHSVMSIAVNQNYEPHMDLESKYTLQDLLETPQDFDNHLGRYAFGVLFRSGLGVKTHTIKDEVVQDILNTNDFAVNCFRPDKYLCNLFSWTLHLPTVLSSEYSFLTTKHQELCTRIRRSQDDMRSKMAHGKAPDCLQRYFIDNQTDFGLSDLEGGGVFETILGAGTRSPHNTLLVFLALMLKYPEWLEKIQEEIDQVVGLNRLPTFADMPHLPTVRAVVKETVRYRSVYTDVGVPHKLRQDDIYEGYFFPAGTLFHANLSAILSEPGMYPDGHSFNPARWLDPSFPTYKEPLTIYPNLQNFASFGHGRRACPGANFTERSMTILAARIAWACQIKTPIDPTTQKEVDVRLEYEPVLNPKPLPFPCDISPKSPERVAIIKKEVEECLRADPLE